MKKTLFCALLLAVVAGAAPFLCLLPVFPAGGQTSAPAALPAAADPDTPFPSADEEKPDEPAGAAGRSDPPAVPATVTVYDAAAGQNLELAVRDFLVGAAACEMPADWPEDALLAQMVASRSYALAQDSPMTVNSAQCLGWTSADVLQTRWGDSYEEWYGRLCTLADSVADALLLYEGQPAAACYHAISCGRTESSQNVWLTALPYLQGVDSPWDRYADGYEVTVQYSAEQLSAALAGLLGAAPEGDAESWLGTMKWDSAGYVDSLEIGGQTVSGSQLRGALGLRSACFAIAWRGGQFVITTRGYGHGVGLSQYGAKAMAEGGSSWQEILTYYFPGTSVSAGASSSG